MYLKTKDGVRLYYNDWGKGHPLILIHGWPLNLDMWEYQARRLAHSGFRVISYDRRGFGRSDHPFEGYNYDQFASDLNDLINALDLQKFSLVGFSMGGGEVARYVGKYGTERIEKIALISSILPFMLKTKDNPTGVDEDVFEDIKQKLLEDRPDFLAEFAKDFYGVSTLHQAVSQEFLRYTSQLALMASPEATYQCVDAFGKTDFRRDCAKINVPTLIIHGGKDKTVPIDASAKEADKLIVGSEARFYEDAYHGMFATHKDRIYEDLVRFFGNLKAEGLAMKTAEVHKRPMST